MIAEIAPRRCRMCSCTDLSACVDEDGPCAWVDDNLCSACLRRAELATAAAHQAVEAAAELLRYAREGDALNSRFDPNLLVVAKLLDAAKMAMEVEGPGTDDWERDQAYAAICQFLEGEVP